MCGALDASDPDHPRGKHPIAHLVPRGKLDASTDPAVIRSWFLNAPPRNLGIETDLSGLVILDVDVSGEKKGRESLAEIDAELTPTLTGITGSGGLHAYYLRPPDMSAFASRIGARPGIDLIGNGYVVVPPSLHVSGQRYKWVNNAAIVTLPRILRDLRKHRAESVIALDAGVQAVIEGGRNNALFRLGASLRATAIGHDAVRAALHLENRRRFSPPLPDNEVDEVAEKVIRHARVERDVAMGAVVENDLAQLLGKEQSEPALWVRDVAVQKAQPVRTYTTGSVQLDHHLGGGIASAMLTGVVGPPSAGKSSYVTTLVMELQKQLPMLHVSTELPRIDLMKRFAASVRGWHWRDALKGKYDGQYLDAVADLQIKLVGSDELDTADPLGFIVKRALEIRDETGHMPGIALDYLQQLARGNDDGMRNRVGDLTLKLRKVSQLLDTPVIIVLTTSREYYAGPNIEKLRAANDPIGYLKAAKESGDIEYDCGNILYVDVDQGATGSPKPARVAIARARIGEVGFAGYQAHLDTGRFVPDALAAVALQTGGSMKDANQGKARAADDTLVLDAIRKDPDKPWTTYRELCGISREKATRAKERLMALGQIVEINQDTYDADHRPIKKRILRLAK